MNTNIIVGFPPNYHKIVKVFPAIVGRPVVITYGEKIYNPTNAFIDEALAIHEGVHQKQQTEYSGGPQAWWERYLTDKTFRLDQEVRAYRAQYLHIQQTQSRQVCRNELKRLAKDLSGAVYGHLCGFDHARDLITCNR